MSPETAAPASPRPNLFIIGAPKCGTTALAAYLGEREDVFLCTPKEPFTLCTDAPSMARRTGIETEAQYLALFAAADPARHRVIAEGSTGYLRSEAAVARAQALNPAARFIVMLRDPVEVAHAFHMEQLFARNEDEPDFETAWRLQEARARGQRLSAHCRVPEFLQYREIAAFGPQMERFFAEVPEERRLVLLQKDLAADPRALWLKTLDFLGLPDDGRMEFPPVNAAHDHKVKWLANLILTPPPALRGPMDAMRGFLRARRFGPVERLKQTLRKPAKREAMRPAFREELREEFAEDVARVEALIGRPLL